MTTKSYKTALMVLLLTSFTINLGFTAVDPVFPYMVLAFKGLLRKLPETVQGTIQAHEGAVEFGLLMAAFMATRAPMAGAVGFMSDVLGRKRIICLGLGIYTLVSTGLILADNISELIFLRALQGIASAMVWPVAQAYLADVTPRWSRGKVMSAFTMSFTLAEIAGPAVGVAIYEGSITLLHITDLLTALRSPFYFLAAMSLLSLILSLLLPKTASEKVSSTSFREVVRAVRSLPPEVARSVKAIYFNGVVNGIAMGIMNTVAIVYMIEEVVKDPLYIGFFSTVLSAVSLPATFLSGYVTDRMHERKTVVMVGYLLGTIAFIAIPLTNNFSTLILIGSIASLTFSFSMPALRALQADLVESDVRGTVFGLQQLFFNGGTFLGAVVGGWITSYAAASSLPGGITGYAIPFWMTAAMDLLSVVVFSAFVTERKDTDERRIKDQGMGDYPLP